MDNLIKIHCTTMTVCTNKWTGQVYKDEEEMKADVANPNTRTTMADIKNRCNCSSITKRIARITESYE
jgi:hypothetical protein